LPDPRFAPLGGLRVLDLSRLLPGPYLTRLLADLGADVIKLEDPTGDLLRYYPPARAGVSGAFAALNWGKRSVVANLKAPLGVEVVTAMARRVDILIESFRPGVLARLGLGYDLLSAANPRLIQVSITGFGLEGPERDTPGHDLTYLARSGVLALSGPTDRPPAVPALQTADLGAGALMAAVGLLAALRERDQTGRGRHLDLSMARGLLGLLLLELGRRAQGVHEPRGAGLLTGGLPCYRVYRAKGDGFMALGALEPKFFASFCARAGCPHLAQYGFAQDDEGRRVTAELEALFLTRTRDEWVQLLLGAGCCCEPVRTPEEALTDPGLGSLFVDVAGMKLPTTHVGVAGTATTGVVPELGEHSIEVARELGLEETLIERAVASGALVQATRAPGQGPA
jgi:alpha-methylacyl-CoA racemase